MAILLYQFEKVAIAHQFEGEKFGLLSGAAGNRKDNRVFENDSASRLWRFTGANLCDGTVAIDNSLDHYLDPAATFLLTEEPSPDDLGIVENQQVAGFYELRQLRRCV